MTAATKGLALLRKSDEMKAVVGLFDLNIVVSLITFSI